MHVAISLLLLGAGETCSQASTRRSWLHLHRARSHGRRDPRRPDEAAENGAAANVRRFTQERAPSSVFLAPEALDPGSQLDPRSSAPAAA
jgi:hypothetical protein